MPSDFERWFIDVDGTIYPIIYLDAHEIECDPEDAEVAIAGREDHWFGFDIRTMQRPTHH